MVDGNADEMPIICEIFQVKFEKSFFTSEFNRAYLQFF